MGQKSRLVVSGFVSALVGAHMLVGTAVAQDFGGGQSYYRSSNERGSGSGSSYNSSRQSINSGFHTTERWGHDYSRSFNRGGWVEPIYRKGEVVGERGQQWDRENNRKADWGSLTGTKWNQERSSWSQGGHENSFGSGRRTFGGRSWGGGFPNGDDE